MEAISWLNDRILGPTVPLVILVVGIFFSIRLRGFILRHPLRIIHGLWTSGRTTNGSFSPFRAMTLALAGTLGVGNIVGVASAILLGGPGAVFWMMISAFFAMFIKYAEVVLAMHCRKMDRDGKFHGGAMYYLPGKFIPALFAIVCLLSSMGLGNFIQVKAAADALQEAFSVPPWLTGTMFSLLAAVVIVGGVKGISDFTLRLIPALSILYLVLSLAIILPNAARIPEVIAMIIREAFTSEALHGGFAGILLSSSLKYGVMRGILSNEAGCGTAPIAHAEADNRKSPVEQGFWGIFEVFADTIMLCSLTALVILLTNQGNGEKNGMLFALKAYQFWLGRSAVTLIGLSAALFAFATVICWAHYGMEALHFLTPNKTAQKGYVLMFIGCTFCGAVMQQNAAWEFADIGIYLMALINTIGLCFRWKDVAILTDAYFRKPQKASKVCRGNPLHRQAIRRYKVQERASRS